MLDQPRTPLLTALKKGGNARVVSMPRVLITLSELVYQEGPCQQILLNGGFEIAYPPKGVTLYEQGLLLQHIQGVDAILAGNEPLNRYVLESSNLRAIARFGVGYDAIDVAAATERGIAVVITPNANQESVAEHAFAMLLGVLRGSLDATKGFATEVGITENRCHRSGAKRSV